MKPTFPIAFVSVLCLPFLFSSSPGVDQMDASLVGHWSFDEDLTADLSKYESHGTLMGKPKKAQGIVGDGCLELNGKGDYLEITENGKTPMHLQNLEIGSISLWFKARTIPIETSISPLFHYGNANGCENMLDASNEGLMIEVGHGKIRKESQGVYFTVFDNPCKLPTFCFDTHSEPHLQDVDGLIQEGEWYHFVAVVGEDFNTGFLNGKEVDYRYYNFKDASASLFFADALSHDRLWLGKGFWDFGKETFFDGYIDDVRIYNIPLGSDQVKSLYDDRNGD